MKKQSFLQGSLLLTGSAIFAKICGALFKLPLTALLGGTGMGYFSCAYGLFLPIYAIFVTGLSTAVARPTADFSARGKYACARKVRQIARMLCLAMGLAGMAICAIFSRFFTQQTAASPEAWPAVMAIAPAILFCCLTAVERGYYEGLCTMTPTAISQALEALAKLAFGLLFCHLFMQIPFVHGSPESRGACGAVLGVTLSTVIGYLSLVCKNITQKSPLTSEPVPTVRHILKLLLKIMIPAALGALVTNLTSLADLLTIMRLFSAMLLSDPADFYQKADLANGIPPEEAAAFVYGSFMGLSITVFNLVPSLTNMLAKSVLPCTAQAWSAGDHRQAADYARQVLLLTGMLAIPAAWGIFAIPDGILIFLFSGKDAEIRAAIPGLRWLAPGLLFLCLSFPVFSLLQAIGREDLPVKIMLPGVILKIIGNLFLIPHFCTAGAAISTSFCYGFILIFALICLQKELKQELHLVKPYCFQIWGGILCAGTARILYDRMREPISERPAFIIAVISAIIIYGFVLILTSQEDLKHLLMQKQKSCI